MPDNSTQNQEEPNSQSVFGTPTTQLSPNSMPLSSGKKPKSSKRKLFTILGAIVVVLLVAGSTVAYLLLSDQKTPEPTSESNTSPLSALGDALKSSLEDPADASVLVYESNSPISIVRKIKNNVWIAADDGSTVLSFSSRRDNPTSNESDYTRVVEKLAKEGFVETEATGNISTDYDSTKAVARYFSSDNIVCVLRNTPESGMYSLQADCAKQADFSKNDSAIGPFAEAYVNSGKSNSGYIAFSKPDVHDSATKDYKTARLDVYELGRSSDGSIAMFYQKSDGKWHFFKNAKDQSKINCDDYDSAEVIDAYLGFTCWDASAKKSSFVQKENPTFEIVPDSAG